MNEMVESSCVCNCLLAFPSFSEFFDFGIFQLSHFQGLSLSPLSRSPLPFFACAFRILVVLFSHFPCSPNFAIFHIPYFPIPSPMIFFQPIFLDFGYLVVSHFPGCSHFLYDLVSQPLYLVFFVFGGYYSLANPFSFVGGVIPPNMRPISNTLLCAPQTQHATSDFRHQALCTYLVATSRPT